MFWNVLLLGAVAGFDPARIGAVAFILSRTRPVRLLVAYFVGGFGVSLIAGVVVLFVLKDVGAGKSSSVPPEIEIAVGALALVVAALVGSGLAARVRDRVNARRAAADGTAGLRDPGGPAATEQPDGTRELVATKEPPGMEKLAALEKVPGLGKLAPRVQGALASESPWLAWIAGVAIGLPSAYYLAAIAVILKAGPAAATQVAAVLVFNVVAFAAVVIPLVGYLLAPDATRARVEAFYDWVGAHQRLVVTALAGGVGAYLVIVGITKL
jgi:Sap, sulfolipid-1-addressing protein